nr:MAG TPA: hypothetical protein [Caudoviricetes sp.]
MIACLYPPFHVFSHILQRTAIKSNKNPHTLRRPSLSVRISCIRNNH